MADTIGPLGPITLLGNQTVHTSEIIGPPGDYDQWTDMSDATFTRLWTYGRPDHAAASAARAGTFLDSNYWPPYEIFAYIKYRAGTNKPNILDPAVSISVYTAGGAYITEFVPLASVGFSSTAGIPIIDDGVIRDYNAFVPTAKAATVYHYLKQPGTYVEVSRYSRGEAIPYDLWLEVFQLNIIVSGAESELPITVAPPARQYPRDDGLATSSAARHYPPPRSEQLSARRGSGGHY